MSRVPEPPPVRYAWLDELPSEIARATVAHVHGSLVARGQAVLAMREGLLAGEVPAPERLPWPEASMREALCEALEKGGVAALCASKPDVTDDVLLSWLDAVNEGHLTRERALVAFHTMARLARAPGGVRYDAESFEPSADELRKLEQEAAQLCRDLLASRIADKALAVRETLALELAMRELTSCLAMPPGTLRGQLRALPRRASAEMRRLLDGVPVFRELIEMLGRLREDAAGGSVLEQVGASVARAVEVEAAADVLDGPGVRGIERSDDIARMLASEATLLAHPALRGLFRARLVERALMTYHAPQVLTKRLQATQRFDDGDAQLTRRLARGPIIVLLDSSGSMAGTPEVFAKAIALQLVGVAHLEKRALLLINFGAHGEYREEELSPEKGLEAMLWLLGASFHGGTDVEEALLGACARLDSSAYRRADIVIVSDGCFAVSRRLRLSVDEVRWRSGARFVGVLAGNGSAFEELGCDAVHHVPRWAWR